MDPENGIVKLCAAGMTAEMQGRPDEALRLYEEAWETAVTPTERCIAAHYLARHQENDEDGNKTELKRTPNQMQAGQA